MKQLFFSLMSQSSLFLIPLIIIIICLSVDIPVLKKKAERFESKELEKIIVNREQLFILDKLLNDAYIIRKPKPSEYEHRKQLIRVFNEIAREIYGNSPTLSLLTILVTCMW